MALKVYTAQDILLGGIGVYLIDERQDGRYPAEPVELKFPQKQDLTKLEKIKPTFLFPWEEGKGFLQSLAEALFEAGYLPTQRKEWQGERKALEYHLEDMRKLVFERPKGG